MMAVKVVVQVGQPSFNIVDICIRLTTGFLGVFDLVNCELGGRVAFLFSTNSVKTNL